MHPSFSLIIFTKILLLEMCFCWSPMQNKKTFLFCIRVCVFNIYSIYLIFYHFIIQILKLFFDFLIKTDLMIIILQLIISQFKHINKTIYIKKPNANKITFSFCIWTRNMRFVLMQNENMFPFFFWSICKIEIHFCDIYSK